MKFTTIEIRATTRKSAIPTTFYEILNQGMDGILAPIDLVLKSASAPSAFLAWLDSSDRPESQMWTATYHYLEPLHSEPVETNEFLIRAVKRNRDGGRMHMNIWLEGDSRVTGIKLDFNNRFNLSFAGHALHDLREYLTSEGLPWDSIDIAMEGYVGESHTREALLAAFEWDVEHGHMLHKKGEIQGWKRSNRRY